MLDLAPQLVAVLGPIASVLFDRIGSTTSALVLMSGGKKLLALKFIPMIWNGLKACADRAWSSGSACEVESRVRKGDGSYRWFLTRYSPVRNDRGQVVRWYVAYTDIEDRKQAEERLQQENVALREEFDKASMFEEIVGASPALRSLFERAAKVAPTDSTILITGGNRNRQGTHCPCYPQQSPRSAKAFVTVNCAAVPRDLIASELFGHEKGAFTGATRRRRGRFELAEGGTIFLDEIGEVPGQTQVALLRVLQERQFERVGGNQAIRADVRVIAATNLDLQSAISSGTFRSDLFYRLDVFPLEVPPLRERRDDIPLLVEYFVNRFASKAGKKIRGINKKTLELLGSYPWPGNVRELQNVIERSVVLCETQNLWVDESWLLLPTMFAQPSRLEGAGAASGPLSKRSESERQTIEAALAKTRGRVAGPRGAAASLGIPAPTLESKIRALRINKYCFKG